MICSYLLTISALLIRI